MGERPIQIVFLLDVTCGSTDVILKHRSLCLACSRVLLSLSGFPNPVRMKCLKWKYVLLKHRDPALVKVPPFMDLKLSSIKSLFDEVKREMRRYDDSSTRPVTTLPLLSSALVDIVQGSVWDSPIIFSPPKSALGKGSGRQGRKWPKIGADIPTPLNLVFVCSCLPATMQQIAESYLPKDLCTHLLKQKINLCWLYDGCVSNDKVSSTISHY